VDVIAAAWDERVVRGAPGVEETVEVVVTVLRDSSGSSRSERKEPHSLVVEDDIVSSTGDLAEDEELLALKSASHTASKNMMGTDEVAASKNVDAAFPSLWE